MLVSSTSMTNIEGESEHNKKGKARLLLKYTNSRGGVSLCPVILSPLSLLSYSNLIGVSRLDIDSLLIPKLLPAYAGRFSRIQAPLVRNLLSLVAEYTVVSQLHLPLLLKQNNFRTKYRLFPYRLF